MSLDADQKFLTRLLTDPSFLQRFLKNPRFDEFSLEQASKFAAIPSEQLRRSALSLIQKRAGAVSNILSRTREALGEEAYFQLFKEHAQGFWPEGVKRHLVDASAFADFLRGQSLSPWVIDLAVWESLMLRFLHSDQKFLFQRLRYRPEALIAASSDRKPPKLSGILLIGLRLSRSGRVRWLIVPWPVGLKGRAPEKRLPAEL